MGNYPIAVLVSGGGTSLQNLIDRIADGRLAADIRVVIADRPCPALERAQKAHIHTVVADPGEGFDEKVSDAIRESGAELIVMAGFLRFWTIPDDFSTRTINIHPSLIPAFCGKGFYGSNVHQAVLDRGCKVTGCTVHFCDNEYDHGPIILQNTVDVVTGDTPESLGERVQASERDALPEAIALIAEDRLRVDGRNVEILPKSHTS